MLKPNSLLSNPPSTEILFWCAFIRTCDHSMSFSQASIFAYKIYDLVKRSKFSVRHMHNVRHTFKSVAALRSALWHKFDELVPEEGEFSVGYFEGKNHAKKWLVSNQDLEAMYTHYDGKDCISLLYDGKQQETEHDLGLGQK